MLTFSYDSLRVLASPRAVHHIVNPPNYSSFPLLTHVINSQSSLKQVWDSILNDNVHTKKKKKKCNFWMQFVFIL